MRSVGGLRQTQHDDRRSGLIDGEGLPVDRLIVDRSIGKYRDSFGEVPFKTFSNINSRFVETSTVTRGDRSLG